MRVKTTILDPFGTPITENIPFLYPDVEGTWLEGFRARFGEVAIGAVYERNFVSIVPNTALTYRIRWEIVA